MDTRMKSLKLTRMTLGITQETAGLLLNLKPQRYGELERDNKWPFAFSLNEARSKFRQFHELRGPVSAMPSRGRPIDSKALAKVWVKRLERYSKFTGTDKAFCEQEGCTTVTLYRWRKMQSVGAL
jgi:DNA-binding XRE family transcriptional regulator